MRVARSLLSTLLATLALAGAPWPAAWSQGSLPERDLKAQILVRALLFVEWSAEITVPGSTLTLCTVDAPQMHETLERLAGQSINSRRLEVRRADLPGLAACHVAWLGPTAQASLKAPARGVLLVGDNPDAIDRGMMISLQTEQQRVVFDVNLAATRGSGLELSSRLLRLARYVRRD